MTKRDELSYGIGAAVDGVMIALAVGFIWSALVAGFIVWLISLTLG
jgi:hypothetical protein